MGILGDYWWNRLIGRKEVIYVNHLKQIADKLDEYGLDAMLVSSEPGEYYAIGMHGEGFTIVAKNECRYFTDSRYIETAEKNVSGATITMTGRSKNYRVLLGQAVTEMGIQKMGFEDCYMTVAQHLAYAEVLPCVLEPAQDLLGDLRASKDADEVALMMEAQRITDAAFSEIIKFIKPGMTEREVAAKLVYDMMCMGANKVSFDPIVVSGANGSLPHGIPSDKKIENGEFVTMDFGCMYGGYCSDMTRTVAVGEPTEEMRKVYDTVLQAQLAGIAATKAGIPGKVIDGAARRVIEVAGYGDYFGHSYGHSLGLEVHESPNASSHEEKLMPVGAVLSAEPGIYLPGRFGVRIEDVTVLTADGCIDITKSPKELIVL